MNSLNFLIYGYIALIIAIIFLFLYFSYYLKFFKKLKEPDEVIPHSDNYFKYIVLIPARNECKVIENLLKNLKEQDYPKDKFDVYVITERLEDKTNALSEKYGFHYILRNDIENKHTKGFALKAGYDYLIDNKIDFDSLIIFDADNRIEKDYISRLNDLKNMGYQIGVGLRHSTNTEYNLVSATSSLLFSYQCAFSCKARHKLFDKVPISGTGYFIDKKIIIDAGGWIFTGLTEDVEITKYSYKHGVKMGYNSKAIFYDEQPIDYKTLHNQHVRWIWGYINNSLRKNDKSKVKYSETPLLARFEYKNVLMVFISFELALIAHIIYMIVMSILCSMQNDIFYQNIFILCIFINVFLMFLICNIVLGVELYISRNIFNASKKVKTKILTFGTFFWVDFMLSFFHGLISRKSRTQWVPVKHKGEKINRE